MKKLMWCLMSVFGLLGTAHADLAMFKTHTFQSAAGATGNGTPLAVDNYSTVGLQVVISDTATVTFEVTSDGTNWASAVCTASGDTAGTLVTTASASAAYQCNIAGYQQFRARVSSFTGGTITVTGRATTAVLGRKGGGGGGGGSGVASSITGSDTLPAEPCTINRVYGEEIDGVATFYYCADGTWVAVNTSGTPSMQQASDVGRKIGNAVSQVTAIREGDDVSGEYWVRYRDASNGLIFDCEKAGVLGDCDKKIKIYAGHIFDFVNNANVSIGKLTESNGAWTNFTLDAGATGNTITSRFYWDLDLCGVSPADGTTTGHIWNRDPLSTPPTLTAGIGTNVGRCYATFPDTDTTYGVQIARHLPDGFVAGTLSADIWWNTTGTGNARFQIQTKCYADDEADDAAFNTATITTAAAGTSGRPNKQNVASIDTTGCAAGELIRIRLFRVRTEASDTLNAALNVEKVFFKGWDAQ